MKKHGEMKMSMKSTAKAKCNLVHNGDSIFQHKFR